MRQNQERKSPLPWGYEQNQQLLQPSYQCSYQSSKVGTASKLNEAGPSEVPAIIGQHSKVPEARTIIEVGDGFLISHAAPTTRITEVA